MRYSSVSTCQRQDKSSYQTDYYSKNNIEDQFFDEEMPLELVGYATSLVRLCKKRQTSKLNLPNTYLAKFWKCSVPTVDRKLKQLQEHGVIRRITSGGDKSVDGKWFRTRIINVRCSKFFLDNQSSNLITHKNNNSLRELTRTLPRREKSTVAGFLELGTLKDTPQHKKRKPTREIKIYQKRFLKNAIEKILETDELDYRFVCLILRKVLGAKDYAIAHYGSKLHFSLRYKPDLFVSILELMVKSYDEIRCPIGWLISELNAVSSNPLTSTNSSQITSNQITSSDLGIHNPDDTQDLGTGVRRVDYELNTQNQLSPQGQKALERLRKRTNEHL